MLKDNGSILVHNVAAGGDIQLEGPGILTHNDIVQRMDALEHGQLVLSQAQGLREGVGAHLAGEFILGNMDGFTLVQHGEVAA